jgi:hypothetical protein
MAGVLSSDLEIRIVRLQGTNTHRAAGDQADALGGAEQRRFIR